MPYNTQCKSGQLVQLFVPQSRVGIFRNERTRSTPLDSKLLFSCNLFYFGAFGTIWLPYKTRCRTGKTGAKSSCHKVASEFFAMKAPDPTHWTLNSHFGVFHTIWDSLVAIEHSVQNGSKLVQKFVPRSLVGILATNTPDPAHWTLNSCFGVFRIIWEHLGLFGCVTTLSVKKVKLVKNFVP